MMIRGTSLAVALLLAAANTSAFAPNNPFLTKSSNVSPLAAYKGGFKDSNPDYSYSPEKPDLSDLPITGNLDNIDKITRMQKVLWPQFSWQSVPGDESSRLYEMFATDISRIGYDDEGRIWSIICPQRGFGNDIVGTFMLEVTVTGVRGWVDEETQSVCAEMGVEGVIWVEPTDNPFVGSFEHLLDSYNLPFSKKHAVKVNGHAVGKPYEEFWPMVNGTDPKFFHPTFAQHWDEAYSVYNLEVEIGRQIMTGNKFVDDFGAMLVELFNDASGNILAEGQKVAWNVWPGEPEDVDTKEWRGHADKWFHSITVEHGYPDGATTSERTYYDGTVYEPKMELKELLGIVKKFVVNNMDTFEKFEIPGKLSIFRYIAHHLFENKVKRIIKKRD